MKLPELPTGIEAVSTARYTEAVLAGKLPIPAPLSTQVQAVMKTLTLSL